MTPLYILAREGNLGPVEIMDRETLEWIETNSSKWKTEGRPELSLNAEEMGLIRKMVPEESYFLNKDHYRTIHGISHILRVSVHMALLNKLTFYNVKKEYLLAAVVHDLRREDDNRDSGHGRRSSEWLKENWDKLGFLTEGVSKSSAWDLVEAMVEYHETDYSVIPVTTMDKYGGAIDLLKTADALDRFRQPKEKWWPNQDFLRIKISPEFFSLARELTIESEKLILSGEDPVKAVFDTADSLLKS